MTDYCYPVLGEEAGLPMYVLGAGARDQEFHFIRGEGYPNHQIIYCVRGNGAPSQATRWIIYLALSSLTRRVYSPYTI